MVYFKRLSLGIFHSDQLLSGERLRRVFLYVSSSISGSLTTVIHRRPGNSIFVLLIVNLFVFEYAPPFLSSLFVTPSNTAGCIAVSLPHRLSLPLALSPMQGSRLLLNLRSLSDPDKTDLEMSTGLRFTGRTPPGNTTTIGGSEFTGTTYTIGAAAEGYSTEIEREGKHVAIQEVEIGSSRSSGYHGRSDV
jgi:hypothetical protein